MMGSCGKQTELSPHTAPTISSIFETHSTINPIPTYEPEFSNVNPLPTTNPTTIAQATITALGENKLMAVPIYNDTLSDGW